VRTGQVTAVRELTGHRGLGVHRVQAQVCLGATVREGYAVISVESSSPEVMEALRALKVALKKDAQRFLEQIENGEPAFKEETA
jgi:hypothetical protein